MKQPCISIDRQAKSYAIFDGFDLKGGFTPYSDEGQALADARAEVAKHTAVEPEIVYPVHQDKPLVHLVKSVSVWMVNEAGAFIHRHGGPKGGNLARLIERRELGAQVSWVPHGGNQVLTAIVPHDWIEPMEDPRVLAAVRDFPSSYQLC